MAQEKYDIIILGGGLAGLSCALHLANEARVLLIEKHRYPHHKVCGEYVSNEVLPYLMSLGIDPMAAGAKSITQFEISTNNGETITAQLPLGGFGMSRYALDNLMYETVKDRIDVVFETATQIQLEKDLFTVTTQDKKEYCGRFVVGAYGKRSNIDTTLERPFIQQKSPWLGVKAHYQYEFPEDTVALHNFEGGYCGLSQTETGAVNACYLTRYDSFKRFGKIALFQQEVMGQNPHLDHFFKHAKLLFEKPLSISQISFSEKKAVTDHIFMIGDSAGLIHPLCGNGMAMAIHSAKLFAEAYAQYSETTDTSRSSLEASYAGTWKEQFGKRLQTGRRIQQLLLNPSLARLGFTAAKIIPALVPTIIKRTHGALLT